VAAAGNDIILHLTKLPYLLLGDESEAFDLEVDAERKGKGADEVIVIIFLGWIVDVHDVLLIGDGGLNAKGIGEAQFST
jgi:hypothetical protein